MVVASGTGLRLRNRSAAFSACRSCSWHVPGSRRLALCRRPIYGQPSAESTTRQASGAHVRCCAQPITQITQFCT